MPNPPRPRQPHYGITGRDIMKWYLFTFFMSLMGAACIVLCGLIAGFHDSHVSDGAWTLVWRIPCATAMFIFGMACFLEVLRFWNTDQVDWVHNFAKWFERAVSERYYALRLRRYQQRSRY